MKQQCDIEKKESSGFSATFKTQKEKFGLSSMLKVTIELLPHIFDPKM